MRRLMLFSISVLTIVALTVPSSAAPATQYVLKNHKAKCVAHYVKRTIKVKERVHGKVKTVRMVGCVYAAPPVPQPIVIAVPVIAPVVAPVAQTPPATLPVTPPVTVPVTTTTQPPVTTTTTQPPPTTTTIPPPTTTTLPPPTTTTLPPLATPTIVWEGYDGPTTENQTVPPILNIPLQDGGINLDILAQAVGKIPGDTLPAGVLTFTVNPVPLHEIVIGSGSDDCSAVVNVATIWPTFWGAGCEIGFLTAGQYEVNVLFTSHDALYANVSGSTVLVNVTS